MIVLQHFVSQKSYISPVEDSALKVADYVTHHTDSIHNAASDTRPTCFSTCNTENCKDNQHRVPIRLSQTIVGLFYSRSLVISML